MLTMLLSMFTVMASAEVPDETTQGTVLVVVRDHGTVGVGSHAYDEDFYANVGDELIATPEQGYKATWKYGLGPLSGNTVKVSQEMVDEGAYLYAEFTKIEDASEPSTVSLTVKVENPDNVANAKVWNGTTEVKSGELKLDAAKVLAGKVSLDATAEGLTYGTNYTVEWKLTNTAAKSGAKYEVPATLEDGKTLTVTFNKVTSHDHDVKLVPAVPATCTTAGSKAYYHCDGCGKNFEDSACKKEITEDINTWKTVKALGHKLTKVEAKAATTTKEGNIEYYKCETCGSLFLDKDAKYPTTKEKVIIEKLKEEEHVLTFTIGKDGKLAYADDGREITSGRTKALKSDDKALELVATADKNCKVVWQLDNGRKHYEGSTAKITVSYEDLNEKSELKVWFEKKSSSDTRRLYVDVSGWTHGDVEYSVNGGKRTDLKKIDKYFTLDEGDYIKFYTDADSNYVARWNIDKDSKSSSTSFTVRYSDVDEDDSTLYISFVKKGSSDVDDYPTLTFDITGEKYGKVYRGTREYEDGDIISIKKNDKMTFKAKVTKSGYVAVWTYKGDTYVGDEYTVKMGATDAKLYVEFMDKDDIRLTELPFRDVSKRDWYYDDVVYVYRKGYMDGMSSTRFGGELNTTRGQIVTILWRLTGEPRATKRNPFNDVSSSQYYYDAISWAYDAGVVDGFDAHTFKPDQNVTREQLAAILYRYAEYMNLSTSGSAYLAKYRDADKIANWAYDAMAWANYHGLINGTSATRIDPKGYATRAQIAAILHRFAVEFGA